MKTLKRNRLYLSVIVVMMFCTGVRTYSGFNDTEFNMCNSILPSDPNECSFTYNFDTISCCSVSMSYPYKGNVCFALSKSAAGTSGTFSRQLPTNIYVQGVFTCSSEFLKISLRLLHVLLIYLFF